MYVFQKLLVHFCCLDFIDYLRTSAVKSVLCHTDTARSVVNLILDSFTDVTSSQLRAVDENWCADLGKYSATWQTQSADVWGGKHVSLEAILSQRFSQSWTAIDSGSAVYVYVTCQQLCCLCWTRFTTMMNLIHCVRKKRDQNVFFVISSIKLGRFWWNLVDSFVNKFAAKSCFPPHLNSVATLPCET